MKREHIMIASALLFLVSVYSIPVDNSQKTYDALREEVSGIGGVSTALGGTVKIGVSLPTPGVSFPTPAQDGASKEILPKYAALRSRNADMVGWISNGGMIDYPIMQSQGDSNFYLSKDFDKQDSMAGSIYIPNDISMGSDIVLIYGHNMRDGSMFGSLMGCQPGEVFKVSDLYSERDYQIVGVFLSEVYDNSYEGFKYYDYRGDITEGRFNEYIAGIAPLMVSGSVDGVSYGDRLVELVTCSYHTDNGRLVVLLKEVSGGQASGN